MDEIIFQSLEELYERLTPALITKASYLKEKKWKNSTNLALHEMVDDILNSEEILIDNYLREKLNRGKRKLYFDESYIEQEEHEEL